MITTPTIELETQYSRLVAYSEAAEDLGLNPKALRPCIGVLLKTPSFDSDVIKPSLRASMIADEFIRLNMPESLMQSQLEKWNTRNIPPMRHRDLMSTIKTALRKNYGYTCSHPSLAEFCVGPEACEHVRGNTGKLKFNFRAFFVYHWQLILSNTAKDIYYIALPELGKRRGLKPDGLIYANQLEIAQYAGISKKSVKSALEELSHFGLIEYKHGRPRKWEGKASEIRRIFPIPKPPKSELLRINNSEFLKGNYYSL